MTSKQIREYLNQDNRLVLPVGSVEQHGPRGVLGTDFMIAEKIAREAAERVQIMCAPSMPYGMSEHHTGFTGTLSLQPMPLVEVYTSILRSAYRSGFRRIVLVNGHGGNTACLSLAGTQAAETCPAILVKISEWFRSPQVTEAIEAEFGEGEGMHATPGELSLVMHLYDGLIGSEQQKDQQRRDLDVILTRHVLEKRYPDGSMSADQNLSNSHFGKNLFEISVKSLVAELENWGSS
jgi:creatinine amidohydrolase